MEKVRAACPALNLQVPAPIAPALLGLGALARNTGLQARSDPGAGLLVDDGVGGLVRTTPLPPPTGAPPAGETETERQDPLVVRRFNTDGQKAKKTPVLITSEAEEEEERRSSRSKKRKKLTKKRSKKSSGSDSSSGKEEEEKENKEP